MYASCLSIEDLICGRVPWSCRVKCAEASATPKMAWEYYEETLGHCRLAITVLLVLKESELFEIVCLWRRLESLTCESVYEIAL